MKPRSGRYHRHAVTVQDEVNAYIEDMRSTPPPPSEEHAKAEVLERMHRDRLKSGSFYVEELQRQLADRLEKEAAGRLSEEIEKRREVERKLEKRDDRIWQVMMLCIGILIAAGAAGIGIGRASAPHDSPHHGAE